MPNPEDVNPKNFKVKQVIFNNGDFSIAYGEWKEDVSCLGMRWNGSKDDVGYPKLFNNPVWFILPEELTVPLALSLFGKEQANAENILAVLQKITT